MKKIIFLIFIFWGILLILTPNAKAEVFSVHLFYNSTGKILSFDKSSLEKVSLNKEKFVSVFDFSDESNEGNYVAKLYDDKGEELISGYFKTRSGTFILDVPYISIASSLRIFNKETMKEILKTDLSRFVSCNRNGTCEFEKGENVYTCILDCASSNVEYSQETKRSLENNGGIIKDPKTGETLLSETQPPSSPSAPEVSDNSTIPNENAENTKNKNNNKMLSVILAVIISAFALVAIYFVVRKKIRK